MKSSPRPQPLGLTMIEVMVFITIVTVAMLATLSAWAKHVKIETISEQRRLAQIAAEQKLDEIRNCIATIRNTNVKVPPVNPLDEAFKKYGPPNPLSAAMNGSTFIAPCCFDVPELPPVPNSKGNPWASVGTVTFINDEAPDATKFGYEYDGTTTPNIFCCNLYGDNYVDPMNYSSGGAFPSTLPPMAPFVQAAPAVTPTPGIAGPANGKYYLDLNNNGLIDTVNTAVTGSTVNSARLPITSGFVVLPVDITMRWLGPSGEVERLDLFAVLSAEAGP
jgi:type II secretory pathway pseudopilin PulG